MRDNLFIPNKLEYARGKARPKVECILCSIVDGSDQVARLVVHESELFTMSLNLYPYSPGHLIIFPNRHLVDVRELNEAEARDIHALQCLSMEVLDGVYQPHGYNIGYNVGDASGRSIKHLHMHVVPRYPRELGMVDIIGGTRIIIEDPNITQEKLCRAFDQHTTKEKGSHGH